jgi:hypothetical protein
MKVLKKLHRQLLNLICVAAEISRTFLLYIIEKLYKEKDKVFLFLLILRLPAIPLLSNIGIRSTSHTERRKTNSERKGVQPWLPLLALSSFTML